MFYTVHVNFFQLNIYRPTGGMAETQPTDWVCPPAWHHHLANNNWQWQVYFQGKFLWTQTFIQLFYSSHINSFQLNTYRSTTGMAETHPTDWVWHPAQPRHQTTNNWQRRVYFQGEFLWTWPFLQLFYLAHTNFFNWILTGQPWEWAKLSLQTEFGILPNIAI